MICLACFGSLISRILDFLWFASVLSCESASREGRGGSNRRENFQSDISTGRESHCKILKLNDNQDGRPVRIVVISWTIRLTDNKANSKRIQPLNECIVLHCESAWLLESCNANWHHGYLDEYPTKYESFCKYDLVFPRDFLFDDSHVLTVEYLAFWIAKLIHSISREF
jgi:hypothetical protein